MERGEASGRLVKEQEGLSQESPLQETHTKRPEKAYSLRGLYELVKGMQERHETLLEESLKKLLERHEAIFEEYRMR